MLKPSCSKLLATRTSLSFTIRPASTAKPTQMWMSSIANSYGHGTSATGATPSAWSVSQVLSLPKRACLSSTASSWQHNAHDAPSSKSGGERERFEAYAADALAAMATGEGPARSARADLVIVCDLFAWRRGHAHAGEVCQVIGGGPVPVELARELGKDAFLKAVLHDGVAVHTIKHFGRHFPAELRTALDLAPCRHLQELGAASAGAASASSTTMSTPWPTRVRPQLSNVQALCWGDHQAKTERDRQAGLLGPSPPYPP